MPLSREDADLLDIEAIPDSHELPFYGTAACVGAAQGDWISTLEPVKRSAEPSQGLLAPTVDFFRNRKDADQPNRAIRLVYCQLFLVPAAPP